jgi:hypothetical protein
MPPFFTTLVSRDSGFNATLSSDEFSDQWTHLVDVFTVLLIVGGDVIGYALAQLAGGWLTPVTFSFGVVNFLKCL